MSGDEWVLDLPPAPYLTPNSRTHWSKRSAAAKVWRHAAWATALQAKIPPQDFIIVRLEYWPPDRRRRDPDNLVSGVLKHVLDGLVDANVVPDDNPQYVQAWMPVIHSPREDRKATWRVTISAQD